MLIVATTSYAGMGPYVSEIVNSFSPEDNILYFFCEYEDHYFEKNVKNVLHAKSAFFYLPNTTWNKIRELLPIKKAYHESVLKLCLENNIEVVHFINNPADFRLVRALRKHGVATISTVHDLHPHEAKKEWYKELRFKIIYAQLYKNLQNEFHLITNSYDQYDELLKTYPQKAIYYHSFPSLVTKNIVDGKDVPPELADLKKPYILFFGRIEEYKGVELLYRAFIELTELRQHYNLVIAGAGSIPFTRDKDDNEVIFINRYIYDTEISSLFQRASCIIYPYLSATQSGVLSLAYYYGIPVMTSDVPFFKRIITDSDAGLLFKAGEKEELMKKIPELVSLSKNDVYEKERLYYTKAFDGRAIRKELIKIYNLVSR